MCARSGGSCHLCSPNTCERRSGGSSHEDRSPIPNIRRSSSTEVSQEQQEETEVKTSFLLWTSQQLQQSYETEAPSGALCTDLSDCREASCRHCWSLACHPSTTQKQAGAKSLTWSLGLPCFNRAGVGTFKVFSVFTHRDHAFCWHRCSGVYVQKCLFFLYIKLVIVFLVLLGNTSCVMVCVWFKVGGAQRDDLSQPTLTRSWSFALPQACIVPLA